MRTTAWVARLVQPSRSRSMLADIRFALRQFLRTPGLTLVAVLSLGVGIGANSLVFSWIQAILLNPLPGVRDAGNMVVLLGKHGERQWDTVSLPDIKDFDQLTEVFAGVIGSQVTPACLTLDGSPQWVYGQIATANYFDVLGVKPILGRLFIPEDGTKPGGNAVLVLSEGLWKRSFGGDPQVIGRSVELNQHSFTIIGVTPGAFRGTMSGLTADFWAPVTMHHEVANFGRLEDRADRWLHTQGRLQPGISLEQARAATIACAERIAMVHPENREIEVAVVPVYQAPYGGQAIFLPALRILLAMAIVVLLIVAANVANLLLTRATARQRETAVRLAIGAGRGRLVRQWLTESALLAIAGGAVGLLFSTWGSGLFGLFMPETHLPAGYDFAVDGQTILFVATLVLVTSLLFGTAPALHASRANLNESLKEGGRGGSGASAPRLRGALVVAEVALALLLLVAGALCITGIRRARQIDPGFDPDGMLVAGLRIGMNGYDEDRGPAFYRELRDRLSSAPGVTGAALCSWFPLGFEGGPALGLEIEGYPRGLNEDVTASFSIVSPEYFSTMRIPLRAGRDFRDDDNLDAPGVAIINETMARRYWAGQDPIGRRFSLWGGRREVEVVGVAKDGKYRSLNEPPGNFMYLPYQQGVWDLNLGVALRTDGDPRALLATLRRELLALDPGVAVWAALPMTEYIKAAYLINRIAMSLLSALGVLALLLSAMGIYGVMAFHVTQRTPEIGVRIALGARPGDVVRMVVSQGMRLVTLGLVLGLAAAWYAAVVLSRILPGVSAQEPGTVALVAALLILVALTACWLPARRASRINPLAALRRE